MDEILKQFGSYGLPGLFIAALIWALIQLSKRLDDVQEKRITESRQCLEAMHASAVALEANTSAIAATKEAFSALKSEHASLKEVLNALVKVVEPRARRT